MEKPIEWLRRAGALFRRDASSGLDEEIRFHIEEQTRKNLAQGMSPAEARRNAMLRFGGVDRVREATRDEYRPVLIDAIVRDIRYGFRSLLRAPAFSLTSVLTLGLGIGAAVTVFSIVNGVLLKPLPYPESERIVRLLPVNDRGERWNTVSEPNYKDWQAESRSFSGMAQLTQPALVSVHGRIEPNRARLTLVSREFFDVMQVRPALGRGFAEDELHEGAAPAAIVSDAYARRWFGDARAALNERLTSGSMTVTIVGVMPPGFDYPGADIWVPREIEPPQTERSASNFRIVSRLAPGVSLEQAQREISAISRNMKARYGEETPMADGAAVRVHDLMTQSVRPTLWLLIAAAALLFIITCANVSNLLLARSAARQRELAVRLAIGAGRLHIVRQLLCESLVLCTAGGGVGVFIAWAGVKGLLAIDPGTLPRIGEVTVDWTVLSFGLLISLVSALVLGLVTLARVGHRGLRTAITDGQRTMAGGRQGQRVRDGLVVAQIALTLVLLTGAGLLTRSFLGLLAVDNGFRTDDALVLDIALPGSGGEDQRLRNATFREGLAERLAALPGVDAAGFINDFPLGGGWYSTGTFIEMSRPDEITSFEEFSAVAQNAKERTGSAGYRVASADYFRTMGIPLIRGRLFEPGDGPDAAHVAVISQSLATAMWPNRDPIGTYIQFGNMDGDLRALRIVGVVGDVREQSPEAIPTSLIYTNFRQRINGATQFSIIVRGPQPASITPVAQRVVRELDPQVPVSVRTVEQALEQSMAGRRFSLVLLGVFASTALLLATLGLYGVISYLVTQRTREIGIRMALGASSRDVMQLIIGKGAALAAVGGAIGIVAALAFTRVLKGMLFGVRATDPVAFGGVLLLIATAVFVASYAPARRAVRVPPSSTLRD